MIDTKLREIAPASHSEGLKIQPPKGESIDPATELSFGVMEDLAKAARMRIGGLHQGPAHLVVKAEIKKAA